MVFHLWNGPRADLWNNVRETHVRKALDGPGALWLEWTLVSLHGWGELKKPPSENTTSLLIAPLSPRHRCRLTVSTVRTEESDGVTVVTSKLWIIVFTLFFFKELVVPLMEDEKKKFFFSSFGLQSKMWSIGLYLYLSIDITRHLARAK